MKMTVLNALVLLALAAPARADLRIYPTGMHLSYATSTVTDVRPGGAVGYSEGVPCSPPPQRAFAYWDWRLDYLPLDGYRDSVFTSLSATRCVGYASTADNSAFVGIYSACGSLHILPNSIAAYGVDGNRAVGKDSAGRPAYWDIASDGGSAAGPYILATGVGGAQAIHGDTIVGSAAGFPYRWTNGLPHLLDDVPGEALDFSAAGIVGRRGTEYGWWSASYEWHALPAAWELACDISDAGLIVGVADGMAAIYDHGTTYALYDWLEARGVNGLDYWVSLDKCNAISDDGSVIGGRGWNTVGRFEGYVVRIPEPTSLALLLLGVAAVRRRP